MRKDKYIKELITIYRRLKRGTNPEFFDALNEAIIETSAENHEEKMTHKFLEYRNLHLKKYIYFDTSSLLINSNDLLKKLPGELKSKFWINIFDPQEIDFIYLKEKFNVNPLTIFDIKNGSPKEKIETFTGYTFIVLRLVGRKGDISLDMNFNILLFKKFIITTHDKKWASVTDIVNFLNLSNNLVQITPDWVFFSVIIELLQDIDHDIDSLRPNIEENLNKIQLNEEGTESTVEIQDLKHNFSLSFELIESLSFIKPKIEILNFFSQRRIKFDLLLLKYLNGCHTDLLLKEKEIKELLRTLERSQDLLLALVNVDMTKEGNAMNKTMKKFTMFSLFFLPIQAISGIWGMNCKVPFQFLGEKDSLFWFFALTIFGLMIPFIFYKEFGLFEKKKEVKKLQIKRMNREIEDSV